uniref:Uncharacterized protein n=1 Tax=Arundo donax TaxID=35708 RepID=A0A0A9BGU2_ARUDO
MQTYIEAPFIVSQSGFISKPFYCKPFLHS